ncbi:uncharacterized protein RJT21DRAFT_24368 [Scheffersomyces amazonensis]|uniref:uncharacterized protein n=1 Tax=Scheffersomyces amazonensis TaxID=1078765 RepID=UPI00315C6C5A
MKQIIKEISINGVDYVMVVTHSSSTQNKINSDGNGKAETSKYGPNPPITVYINESGNQSMGQYIYTIQSYSTSLNSQKSSATEDNNSLASLNYLLNKKFNTPIYLNFNGSYDGLTLTIPLFSEISNVLVN